ncbi:hypothetical protein ASG17_10655 [Brevundimonas sp. Leaf363]|uniref:hypothetical protein n=1 Tax=Brevundimonas sp. Leaf363 TaxID=1736353 RepID=UPI0006FA7463|nr:hypothetical protein [Brevundimonas sp. Leaf363]KQS56441.1 hypothetical protein ASG17_10655 [Brevundimonas sp. Leaf363]
MSEELERLTARRVTLIYRLDLISKGATLSYDDGTPVDMKSEKARLEDEVKRLDRKIALWGPAAGQA